MNKSKLLAAMRKAQAAKIAAQEQEAAKREKQLAHVPLHGTISNTTTTKTHEDAGHEKATGKLEGQHDGTEYAGEAQSTGKTGLDSGIGIANSLVHNSGNVHSAENAVVIGGKTLYFNEAQMRARQLMREGKEFCLIGSAGSGKTSTTAGIGKELVSRLLTEGNGQFRENLIGIVSFTNRAVLNIYSALQSVPELQEYCKTIHKFLQYKPEWFEYTDDAGDLQKTMRFVPTYTASNPIEDCRLVIIEESSMVNIELYKKLHDACPNAVFIFIGDLNQLDPVMGRAILGFKLNEIPVVELTEIYRQAMDSPIVGFQHNYVLQGKSLGDSTLARISEESNGKLKFIKIQGENKFAPEKLAAVFGTYMANLLDAGKYNPDEDIILIPNNDGFGRNPINKVIAQHISKKNNQPVYEIICGFETRYFAVGDKVIHNREEWYIEEIKVNPAFTIETHIQNPNVNMNRYGIITGDGEVSDGEIEQEFAHKDDLSLDALLAMTQHAVGSSRDEDDTVNQASHTIVLRKAILLEGESDELVPINRRGDVSKLEFGYAITVHKSQGSEWRRVFFVLGKYNKRMCSRELLYTGMTRAREELQMFYSPDTGVGRNDNTISLSIKRQRIPGKTWQEKAKYFAQHQKDYEDYMESDEEIDTIMRVVDREVKQVTEAKEKINSAIGDLFDF